MIPLFYLLQEWCLYKSECYIAAAGSEENRMPRRQRVRLILIEKPCIIDVGGVPNEKT